MLKKLLIIFVSFILLLPPLVSGAAAAQDPAEIAREINSGLESAFARYEAGDREKARAIAQEAYFIKFEGMGLEAALEARSPSKMYEIEGLFIKLNQEIDSGSSSATVRAAIDELTDKLGFAVISLEKDKRQGGLSLFINALIIILREGFEALLIISALSAYLVKIGRKEQVRIIYAGASSALAASIIMAVLFQIFLSASGVGRPTLEGATMVFAAVILFYVSYWLIGKIQVVKWQKYIKSKVDDALGKGNIYTLGFAAFLAVFREGAETVLFYQALYSSAGEGTTYILGGFGLGILILIGLFFALRYGAVKIPLAPFFAVTSTLLYYLAFTFAGKGILELQEAGWVSTTHIRAVPTVRFLGIYPSLEGISIQLLLILAMLAAVVYSFLLKPYLEREKRLKEIVHIASDISGLHDTLEHITHHAMLCQELSSENEGKEVEEIRRHLKEIDSKAHEVMGHLHKLEAALSDVFEDMESSFKKES
ncbi:MAG: FTR1 family iron permease [Deltaproteobacteria bacterium]|nr:FTR1 family iron permease [Deltaproteobacteria bacterium]